jgi:hypothetical protein
VFKRTLEVDKLEKQVIDAILKVKAIEKENKR